MNEKQKFSAKVCFWCGVGFVLCIILAVATGGRRVEQKIPTYVTNEMIFEAVKTLEQVVVIFGLCVLTSVWVAHFLKK